MCARLEKEKIQRNTLCERTIWRQEENEDFCISFDTFKGMKGGIFGQTERFSFAFVKRAA